MNTCAESTEVRNGLCFVNVKQICKPPLRVLQGTKNGDITTFAHPGIEVWADKMTDRSGTGGIDNIWTTGRGNLPYISGITNQPAITFKFNKPRVISELKTVVHFVKHKNLKMDLYCMGTVDGAAWQNKFDANWILLKAGAATGSGPIRVDFEAADIAGFRCEALMLRVADGTQDLWLQAIDSVVLFEDTPAP